MTACPRCSFKVRIPAGNGKYRFETVFLSVPGGGASVPLQYPPPIGVIVSLYDSRGEGFQPDKSMSYRVLDQMWHYPQYGSGSWPYGANEPREGPLVDIIVEPAAGLYADETEICGYEDGCSRYLMNGQWVMPFGEEDYAAPHEHFPWKPKD